MLALFVLLFYKHLKLNRIDVLFCGLLLALLVLSYVFTSNPNIIRFIIYVPRFLFLIAILRILSTFLNYRSLSLIVQSIFFIHTFIILACYAIPPFNAVIDSLPWKYGQSTVRISGLFSGYDFISFLTVVFLYTEYVCNGSKLDMRRVMMLLIGFAATAVTGRFGLTLYMVFFLYLFLKDFSISKVFLLLFGGAATFVVFSERIMLFYNTFLLIKDSLALDDPNNTNLRLEDYGTQGEHDFYELSPLTLWHELTLPFIKWADYILPNAQNITVDPGPSFVILNLGFLLFFLVYIYNFKLLFSGGSMVLMLLLFVILMDIKFRSALVLLPNVWLFFNLERIRLYKTRMNDTFVQ